MNWWSNNYQRPLKDPILQSYSFEELVYEYMSKAAWEEARENRNKAESDKIEQEQWDAAEAWADAMEAEENHKGPEKDPRLDPINQEWMEEQMRLNKEEFGEDFGEGFDLSFDEDI